MYATKTKLVHQAMLEFPRQCRGNFQPIDKKLFLCEIISVLPKETFRVLQSVFSSTSILYFH